MSRINIRKGFNNYYKKNKKWYFLFVLCIVVGFTVGVLFSCGVGEEKATVLTDNIKNAFSLLNEKSKFEIFLRLFLKNLRLVAFVFFATISVYTLPFLFIHIILWSFSISFTFAFLTFSFGKWGFVAVVLLMITQFIVIMPCYVVLCVTGVDCTLHNIKTNKKIRKTNRNKFLIFCIIVLMFFSTVSFIDLTIISNMIKNISAYI